MDVVATKQTFRTRDQEARPILIKDNLRSAPVYITVPTVIVYHPNGDKQMDRHLVVSSVLQDFKQKQKAIKASLYPNGGCTDIPLSVVDEQALRTRKCANISLTAIAYDL